MFKYTDSGRHFQCDAIFALNAKQTCMKEITLCILCIYIHTIRGHF